jgi:hypothetical protein
MGGARQNLHVVLQIQSRVEYRLNRRSRELSEAMSLDSPDGLDDCCRGLDFSGVFTLPIRAKEITLADIATTQEKREAVQILVPAPFTLIESRAREVARAKRPAY